MYKQASRVVQRAQPRIACALRQGGSTRALAVKATASSHDQYSTFPRTALLGALAASGAAAALAWNNIAQAEEKPSPIFSSKDVEVFAVIGLCSTCPKRSADLSYVTSRSSSLR